MSWVTSVSCATAPLPEAARGASISSTARLVLPGLLAVVALAPVPAQASQLGAPGARLSSGEAVARAQDVRASLAPAIRRAKLTASDGGADDVFGNSVAVSGDTALVGARFDDTPAGIDAGSVYVFVRSGTAWTEQAHLTAPDGAEGDLFGYSVAVSGDTAVVGAASDTTPAGTQAGSAYVFVRSGTAWTEEAHLTGSDGATFDFFGYSVAVDRDTAVVGAYGDDSFVGSAYVFGRFGTAWIQQAHVTASDGAFLDGFGFSVALSGTTAVVGAEGDDTPAGTDAGSAYVFGRVGTAWIQQAHLSSSDGAAGDSFGFSVALSGKTAAVGAEGDDTPAGIDAGSAYVFGRFGTAWIQQAHLSSSDGAGGDSFGFSVALSGNTAVVGSWRDDTQGTDTGSAYVFVRSGAAWTQRTHLLAQDGAAMDFFGYSVAVSGNIAVVGALRDDILAGTDAGSAWVYWQTVRAPEGR